MRDFVLRTSTRAAMNAWLKQAPHDLINADNMPKDGVAICWWNGRSLPEGAAAPFPADEGKIMTADRVGGAPGTETYLPGVVVLIRFHGATFLNDKLDPDDNDPDKDEQWARSVFARYIKNNGAPNPANPEFGIRYYTLDNARLYRAADVFEKLAQAGLPHHEWYGGNVI